ncbi:hypothetical protein F4821DRAFT_50749 [Hypoxylon rubiginosum]|uniref:Uncharacterized protein n=1 Tax=Hypoxylon rubiginosum TaxID=110542 RepID=A0ACC0DAQ8_9PEZI|nr:hypothetical protein F4821DRAFT_50749 [Hypoxylon rubiginosum]
MPPNYQGKTGKTLEEYIENAGSHPPPEAFKQKHVYEGEPPVSFFTNPPNPDQLRLAIFSTKNGSQPFRNVENPTFERDVVMWSAQEIQDYATEIRSKYFGLCKYIKYPVGPTYEELYTYWDAHDIYHMGAQNLWNVLNHMAFETIWINKELRDECAPWIEEYVSEVLTRNENAREKLKAYNAADHGDLLDYFSDIDLPECGKLDPCYHDTLRDILMSNIMRLRRGGAVDPQYRINTQPFEGAYEMGSTDHGKYFHAFSFHLFRFRFHPISMYLVC